MMPKKKKKTKKTKKNKKKKKVTGGWRKLHNGEIYDLCSSPYTVELGYNVMKGTEHFVSLQTSLVIT
jgi:hypothetical protein